MLSPANEITGIAILLGSLPPAPRSIRQQADEAYDRFQQNPNHPALQFKPIQNITGVYSARINSQYRVLGRMRKGEIYWYWIGTHNDYNAQLQSRRQPETS